MGRACLLPRLISLACWTEPEEVIQGGGWPGWAGDWLLKGRAERALMQDGSAGTLGRSYFSKHSAYKRLSGAKEKVSTSLKIRIVAWK